MKVCRKCRRELPEDSFYKSSASADGLQLYCKECQSKYLQRYRKTVRDNIEKFASVKSEPMPALARYTDEQLTCELYARGYSGKIAKRKTLVF